MPNAVRLFAMLSYGSLALGLLAIIVLLPMMVPGYAPVQSPLGGLAHLSPTVLFSFVFPAALVWLAAWKRQGWARIVLAVFFVFGVLSVVVTNAISDVGSWPVVAFFALQTFLQGLALAFAFSPAARPWFANSRPI
jgi:hypothetical protein